MQVISVHKWKSHLAISAPSKRKTLSWYDFFHKILELTMVKAPALNVVSPLWKSVSITSLISNEKFCSTQYLLKNNMQQSTSWRITQTLSHRVQIHAHYFIHSSYYARLAPHIFLRPSSSSSIFCNKFLQINIPFTLKHTVSPVGVYFKLHALEALQD